MICSKNEGRPWCVDVSLERLKSSGSQDVLLMLCNGIGNSGAASLTKAVGSGSVCGALIALHSLVTGSPVEEGSSLGLGSNVFTCSLDVMQS